MARVVGGTAHVIDSHSNLIAGVLTVLAALLSITLVFVGSSRQEAVDNVGALERENAALRQQVNTLNGTVDSLEATNAGLQGRVTQLEQAIGEEDPESVPDPDDPLIRNKGLLTLASSGLTADLNADDDQWGTDLGLTSDDRDTVTFYGDDLWFGDVGKGEVDVARPDIPANYNSCSETTAYTVSVDSFDANTIDINGLCVRLDSGRLAAIKVQELTGDAITVQITTWEAQ